MAVIFISTSLIKQCSELCDLVAFAVMHCIEWCTHAQWCTALMLLHAIQRYLRIFVKYSEFLLFCSSYNHNACWIPHSCQGFALCSILDLWENQRGSAMYFWLILTIFFGVNAIFGGWEAPPPPDKSSIDFVHFNWTNMVNDEFDDDMIDDGDLWWW